MDIMKMHRRLMAMPNPVGRRARRLRTAIARRCGQTDGRFRGSGSGVTDGASRVRVGWLSATQLNLIPTFSVDLRAYLLVPTLRAGVEQIGAVLPLGPQRVFAGGYVVDAFFPGGQLRRAVYRGRRRAMAAAQKWAARWDGHFAPARATVTHRGKVLGGWTSTPQAREVTCSQ